MGSGTLGAVVRLYNALFALTSSPVFPINRALAIAELQGAFGGLEAIEEVSADIRLAEDYVGNSKAASFPAREAGAGGRS
ncbi:MAG: hypothetical protein WB676_19655 [Bryobacteraceae bacterium]